MDLKSKITNIVDYPQPGIIFRDITTLLKDGEAFKYSVDKMVSKLKDKSIDLILSPEARGFLIGAPVAHSLGIGFVPARKPGKLPREIKKFEYDLEYGRNALEVHKDAISKGDRVAIIDDLLATGGTVNAMVNMVEEFGGEVVTLNFLIELTGLNARESLAKYELDSLIKY